MRVNPADTIVWHSLSAEQRARLIAVAGRVFQRDARVIVAYFHGSAAEGLRPARDFDIAVLARGVPGRRDVEQWRTELARGAGLDETELDIRLLNGESSVFVAQVLRKGARIYEADREARIRFEASAISRWLDFQPVWQKARQRVLARWSDG